MQKKRKVAELASLLGQQVGQHSRQRKGAHSRALHQMQVHAYSKEGEKTKRQQQQEGKKAKVRRKEAEKKTRGIGTLKPKTKQKVLRCQSAETLVQVFLHHQGFRGKIVSSCLIAQAVCGAGKEDTFRYLPVLDLT